MQNFWQNRKGHVFFICKIFHIRSTRYLVKLSLWTNAPSYFDSVFFRQWNIKASGHSLFILNIMINEELFLGDLNQVFSNRALASSVSVKNGALTSRAVSLVHPKRFNGNKL